MLNKISACRTRALYVSKTYRSTFTGGQTFQWQDEEKESKGEYGEAFQGARLLIERSARDSTSIKYRLTRTP